MYVCCPYDPHYSYHPYDPYYSYYFRPILENPIGPPDGTPIGQARWKMAIGLLFCSHRAIGPSGPYGRDGLEVPSLSGENTADTRPVWPLKVCLHSPEQASQSFALPSIDPVRTSGVHCCLTIFIDSPWIFIDFDRFFMDFHGFSWIFMDFH